MVACGFGEDDVVSVRQLDVPFGDGASRSLSFFLESELNIRIGRPDFDVKSRENGCCIERSTNLPGLARNDRFFECLVAVTLFVQQDDVLARRQTGVRISAVVADRCCAIMSMRRRSFLPWWP